MKKFTSLLLIVMMAISLVSVAAFSVSADEVEQLTIAPCYGEIENWSGGTWFITGVTSSDNATLYGGFKDGTLSMKVAIADETDGKTYVIDKYEFAKVGSEIYATSFLRLSVCDYGIVPVVGHTYTVKIVVTDAEGNAVAAGVSETGAFDGFNADITTNGAIVPEEVPYTCRTLDGIFPEEDVEPVKPTLEKDITIAPIFGCVENWSEKTWFITQITSTYDTALYAGLKDGTYALKLVIADQTNNKTYTIDKYAFDNVGDEIYDTASLKFIRIAVCEYGITPVEGNAYTVKAIITDAAGEVVCEGVSETGAFASYNDAFVTAGGAIVPDEVPHQAIVEDGIFPEDVPVNPPVEPDQPITGDATVYAIVFAVVALMGMGVVVTKKVRA